MKVLQLCIKPPFPPVDGGTLAMNSITQGLLGAGCKVKVLSMCSDKHPVLESRMTDDYRQATRFEAVYVDLGIHPIDAGLAWLCGESYHAKRFNSKTFASRLAEVLRAEEFDVVHLESIFLSTYVPLIRKYSKAAVILRAHNVENQIWQRISASEHNPFRRGYLKHLSLTLRAYELEHINDYDGIVCITENDADYFRQNGCRKEVISIPFGITPCVPDNVAEEPGTLFHIGSMDWLPNLEGINWFLERVWPVVHERIPQLSLYLAGRKMPEHLMRLNMEGVKVVGEVADATYFIASKQINVVPLLSGSGIRVKIIEAMSLGKTVISTTIGAQGIGCTNGEHLLLADTPDAFAEQIQRCVNDPEFCHRIGRNAYDFILHSYSTATLTNQLLDFYGKRINFT